jgi:phosphoesterase RecJ-like protein
MYKEINKLIKKYNSIVIARHVGGDIDALGSQIGLKEIIKETYPDKKVYAVGAYSSRFKFVGPLDKEDEIDFDNSLLIVLDTPKVSRIDIEDLSKYKHRIKIDHHPFEEEFCDVELINEDKSSACEMIIDLVANTKLKMNKSAAEKLYMGIVSDTNRFLYPSSGADTMSLAAKLIKDYGVNPPELYEKMYLRSIDEIRFIGFIFQNIKVTENGVGYIKITDEIQKEFGMDAASTGNMIGELSYVDELLAWITFSEDKKQNMVRVSIRSRGPVINTLAMQYNGGGHKLASGIRLPNFDLADEIVEKLDNVCEEYIKKH